MIEELVSKFPLPVYTNTIGEQSKKYFIKLYGGIFKSKNIISSFDDFVGNEIFIERNFQEYQSAYIDLYQTLRKGKGADKENINDDIVFEMELVKQVEINIDYILNWWLNIIKAR